MQVAETLNAAHCQMALKAMQENSATRPLTEQDFQAALKLVKHLAKFRAKRPLCAAGNVSISSTSRFQMSYIRANITFCTLRSMRRSRIILLALV